MPFSDPPTVAAWLHQQARTGFEVVGVQSGRDDGWVLNGCTSAVEDREAWVVDYEIELSADWTTRSARVTRASERSAAASPLKVTDEAAGALMVFDTRT